MNAYEPSSKRVREENLLVLMFDFLHMNKILPSRLMAWGSLHGSTQDRIHEENG